MIQTQGGKWFKWNESYKHTHTLYPGFHVRESASVSYACNNVDPVMQKQLNCPHPMYVLNVYTMCRVDKVWGSVDNEMINKAGHVIGSQQEK